MRVTAITSAIVATVGLSSLASGQTLQLPTFSFFTVNTTVSVPDGGAAFLGGVSSAAEGRNEFGIPGLAFPGLQNRSIGQNMGATSSWASVTIHDFDAMDQALLNSPSPGGLANLLPNGNHSISDVPIQWAAPRPQLEQINLAGNWLPAPAAAAPVSKVAVEEADCAVRRATRSSEADTYFARGQNAEADGKLNVAKIYYQMAARRASGEFKQQVMARLDVVSGRTTALAKNAQ